MIHTSIQTKNTELFKDIQRLYKKILVYHIMI